MKLLVEITVDRLGVSPDVAAKMIRDHLPEWVTDDDGYTVLVTDVRIKRIETDPIGSPCPSCFQLVCSCGV